VTETAEGDGNKKVEIMAYNKMESKGKIITSDDL